MWLSGTRLHTKLLLTVPAFASSSAFSLPQCPVWAFIHLSCTVLSSASFVRALWQYKEYLDETCKLAVPKKTVRNLINSPWITYSIILAIDKTDDLYSNWESTCTKKDPLGDRSVHKIFSDYRRILKHIITDEKKKYRDKKFLNASGDPKKTWQIINQLRGKQKRTMKDVFIIDNQRIIERRIIAN